MRTSFDVQMRFGDIGLSGGEAFHQKAIRYFTKSLWSHSFTIAPTIGVDVDICTPELEHLCSIETTETRAIVQPLANKLEEPDWFFVYRPRADKYKMIDAIYASWEDNSCEFYGYLSYLWFIYAWAVQKISGKYPTTVWKWAKKGTTCTEYTVTYIKNLGGEFQKLIGDDDRSSWHPQRLQEAMDSRPDLFEKIGWANPPTMK